MGGNAGGFTQHELEDGLDLPPAKGRSVALMKGWQAIGGIVRSSYRMGDPEHPGLEVASTPAWMPEEERFAVARLIAAAPEMLEALEACFFNEVGLTLATSVKANGWQWPDSAPETVSITAELARAALSKASPQTDGEG